MATDYDTLMGWQVPEARQTYTERDTMLYALGLGIGFDPSDPGQLGFVYEKGLKAMPSMGVVMGSPGAWFTDPRLGLDMTKLVNAGVSASFHAPLPVSGELVGRSRVTAAIDKGKDRGALVLFRRELYDTRGNRHLCDIDTTYLFRGDGGFGGPGGAVPAPHEIPEGAPERTFDFPTVAQAALIYRLSGDSNPLHADPAVARAAGFPRAILHGLCTYGIAAYAVLSTFCDHDPEKLKLIEGRFSAPVFPGETLRFEFWRRGDVVSLRARSLERDIVVMNNGRARIAA